MLKQSFIAGLLTIVVSLAASANPLSYTNLSIAYTERDIADQDYDGYKIAASIALSEALFVFASQESLESQKQFVIASSLAQTIDADSTRLGLGYHTPIAESMDVLVSIAYLQSEQVFNQLLEDVDGFELALGLRVKTTDKIELSGIFTQQSLDESKTGLVDFAARYFVKSGISIGAGYRLEMDKLGDNDQLIVDLRFDF